METIRALQQTMVATKADKDRILSEVQAEQTVSQNRFQVDLDVSRIDNEELRKPMRNCAENCNAWGSE